MILQAAMKSQINISIVLFSRSCPRSRGSRWELLGPAGLRFLCPWNPSLFFFLMFCFVFSFDFFVLSLHWLGKSSPKVANCHYQPHVPRFCWAQGVGDTAVSSWLTSKAQASSW